jgi:GAF domain-containing protein
MPLDRRVLTEQIPAEEATATPRAVDELVRFDGPPEEFLSRLLALQCRVAPASSGALLRLGNEGRPDILALYPQLPAGSQAPPWLARAVEAAPQATQGREPVVLPVHAEGSLYGQAPDRHAIVLPLRGGGFVGAAAFLLETRDEAEVERRRERLEVGVGLMALYEMRLALQRRQYDLARLEHALEVMPSVNEHDRFMAAAMALANEAASRWGCERVSLGFLKGRYVRLRAMSHTEKFSRKMQLVQDIEAAMEECLDQDEEIVHPAEHTATTVSRAAAELSRRHGPSAVLSLPLRYGGEVIAVLTLERDAEQPFTVDEIESIRLTCELLTPRLKTLHEDDLWFGSRAVKTARKAVGAVVGPKHTWKKVIAVLVAGLICFAAFARGDYTAEAPFTLKARDHRVVPAPFDGFLKKVHVRPGDRVTKGQVIVELDSRELKIKIAEARAEWARAMAAAKQARRDDKEGEAQKAEAQARSYQKRMELLEHYVGKAELRAAIGGVIVGEDLTRQVDAPVQTGDTLYEIVKIESLRAELAVPEDLIVDVEDRAETLGSKGDSLHGQLATVSYPSQPIPFEVEQISPVAKVIAERNVYVVRAKLTETREWMRPGMEGLAKIHLGRERYAWLWTRRLVNWVRMKLWSLGLA